MGIVVVSEGVVVMMIDMVEGMLGPTGPAGHDGKPRFTLNLSATVTPVPKATARRTYLRGAPRSTFFSTLRQHNPNFLSSADLV